MYSTEREVYAVELLNNLGITMDMLPENIPIDVSNHKIQLQSSLGRWNNLTHIIKKSLSDEFLIRVENEEPLSVSGNHAIFVKNTNTQEEKWELTEHLFAECECYEVKHNNSFKKFTVNKTDHKIPILDFALDGDHSYLSNGILSHNTMFGDRLTTSGGKALGFHASVRVRLKSIGKLKSGSGKTEEIVGTQVEAQVIKNRIGPPFKKAIFDIHFRSGIDNYNSWLTKLKDYGYISGGSGGNYSVIREDTGEIVKFQSSNWSHMLAEDQDFRDYCYSKLCDIYVKTYRKQDEINPEDITVDDSGEMEE